MDSYWGWEGYLFLMALLQWRNMPIFWCRTLSRTSLLCFVHSKYGFNSWSIRVSASSDAQLYSWITHRWFPWVSAPRVTYVTTCRWCTRVSESSARRFLASMVVLLPRSEVHRILYFMSRFSISRCAELSILPLAPWQEWFPKDRIQDISCGTFSAYTVK